jgi:hypothetical protein
VRQPEIKQVGQKQARRLGSRWRLESKVRL